MAKKDAQCNSSLVLMSITIVTVTKVIVIARGQGFMAVNGPSPRAKPEDKVCLLP